MTIEDFKQKGWIYIDKIDSLPSVRSFHCDTRDFCITASDEPETEDGHTTPWTGAYLKLVNDKKCKQEFLIDKDEILKFLKMLETISGGKARWRMLSFDEQLPDNTGWDYKYIRFYKWNPDPNKYIVCGGYGTAVHWKDLNEVNLDKEYLCTH